jgi:hypothetical protein
MIHVDHHPSTISSNSNKNDILWSHQKPFTQDFLPQRPDSLPSPTNLPDGNPTSPTREERSSSLSPPPEPTVTKYPDPRMALAEEGKASLEILQREEEEEEDPCMNLPEIEEEEELTTQSRNALETNEKESRQSTPLSDLSPPPEDDHDTEPAADSQPVDVESSSSPQPHRTSSPPKSAVDNTRAGSSSSTRTLRSMSSRSPTSQPQSQSQPQVPPKPLPPQQQQQQPLIPSASSKHTPSDDLVTPATITPTSALLQDPKVVSILEVNVELLKCVFFSLVFALNPVVFIIVITNHYIRLLTTCLFLS